jgi:NADH-quinone oxidoreductase subunit G
MVKIWIDGKPFEVGEGLTVLKAANLAGISIPHLCYHPAFVPEGSCRMCLVEIEGLPKLELACSTVVKEGMKVSTASPAVLEARRGVLEFLLAEHPLDCPICDKAGECKLQDYSAEYGLFSGQFQEFKEKRAKKVVIAKNLILDRERCILCTRCVRFLAAVTKTQELGVFRRGIHSEIGTYENELVDNNYSGNLVDLCPVGAITDSNFRFKTRTWFLDSRESICPLCGRGCSIFIDHLPGFPRLEGTKKVLRIRARENPKVNGYWICDLGRYGYSFLDQERREKPVINQNGKEIRISWDKALILLVEKIKALNIRDKTSRIGVVAHSGLTNEELFLLRKIFRDELKMGRIFFVDPPQGAADDFLLTSDRSPNKKGAQEIGYDMTRPTLEVLSKDTDILLVFGSYLLDHFSLASLQNSLAGIRTKVLFASHGGSLNGLFDVVLPVSLIAEKSGSLTNVDGAVQKFAGALETRGESLPEWRFLVFLGKELSAQPKFYSQFTSPESIFEELAKEVPFFKKPK